MMILRYRSTCSKTALPGIQAAKAGSAKPGWKRGAGSALGIALLILSLQGCATVISKNVRSQASTELGVRAVQQDTERYVGTVVIWSGTVLEAQNTREGTLLSILEKPADYRGKPRMTDLTEGRFLALDRRYLDPAIYSKGRAVTVAGRVAGKRVLPQGEIEYAYPLLDVMELHLWPEEVYDRYYGDPYYYGYPYWHGRWGWGWTWWP